MCVLWRMILVLDIPETKDKCRHLSHMKLNPDHLCSAFTEPLTNVMAKLTWFMPEIPITVLLFSEQELRNLENAPTISSQSGITVWGN